MAKVKQIPEEPGVYLFYCPGCNENHYVHTESCNHSGAKWTFNNDLDKPTFGPSINRWYNGSIEDNVPDYRCHSFVQNGVIKFLGDCTHELKNQCVELPDLK